MSKIAIIGAGELGLALGRVLGGHDKIYWDKDELKLEQTPTPARSLPETLAEARFGFLTVPAENLKEVLAFARPYWAPQTIVVIWSKGLDPLTGKLPPEIAEKLLPRGTGLVLAGGLTPAVAIAGDGRGAVLLAGELSPAGETATLFVGTNVSARVWPDAIGLAWSGALKRIYATIWAGESDRLPTDRDWFFGRAYAEAFKLNKILGGKPETWLASETLADWREFNSDGSTTQDLAARLALLKRLGAVVNEHKFPLLFRRLED